MVPSLPELCGQVVYARGMRLDLMAGGRKEEGKRAKGGQEYAKILVLKVGLGTRE